MPTPASATIFRSSASCGSQPVVPSTMLMPCRASAVTLDNHRVRRGEVDRDVDRSLPPRIVECRRLRLRHRVDDAGDLAAVLRRELADEPAHLAVADQEDPHQAPTFAPKNWSCKQVHRRRHVRIAQHEGDVPARGRLRDQPKRNLVERRHRAAEQRRVGPQVLADDADNGHVALGRHLGEVPEVAEDVVETARVVDRDRYAHLGGRDHVDRRLEALEHLEQPPQEAEAP